MPRIPEDLFTGEIGRAALPVLRRVRKGEISGEEAVAATLEAMRCKVETAVSTIWHAQGGIEARLRALCSTAKEAEKTPES